jgi:E3 ubiquitin-protein ligase DOA10
MPQKIPFGVLVLGLVKKVIRGTRISLSLSFAAILWLLAVPIVTSQIFRYYFGWSLQGLLQSAFSLSIEDVDDFILESSLAVLFDTIQGFLLTCFTVFLILGMMLVREFISMIRHTPPEPPTTTRNNRREREETEAIALAMNNPTTEISETASVTSTLRSPLSPSSPAVSPLSPTRRHSEFTRTTPLSPSSTNTSGNFWLDQVHPKEYRNYLRRRELHRELIEAEQNRSFTSAQENELMFTDSAENDPLLLSEDHVSNISGTTTLRSRFTTATSSSRPTGSESFRCRVCSSNTCINREHVIQASQIRNSLAAQRHQSLLQRANEANSEPSDTVTETNGTTPTPPPTTNNQADGFGWNLDAAESLSFPEFFGLTLEGTPVLELLQNAAIVVGCNTLVMHLFLFVPYITGKAVLNGSVIKAAIKVLETILMLILKAESIQTIANIFSTRSNEIIKVLLPSTINRYLELFTFEKDSLFAFGLHVVLGYAVICSLFSVYMKLARKLTDSVHRILVPVASFVGTFIKLITLLFVEMAGFPLICGFMVDFACLPLFPDSSVFIRLQAVKSLPITGLAVHWALGAFFMISFASFVTFLRSFLRPGLLFFLRNPVDPDNHPVKEMAERGFLDQIYRLGISVIFYSVLVSSSLGLTVKILQLPLISSLVFPLNIKFNDPLIEIPIDLLIHLLLRSLLNSFFPSKLFKNVLKSASRTVIRSLNLSSYFIGGGRYLNEESFPKGGNWVAVPDFDRIYKRDRLKEIRKKTVTPVDISKLKILVDRQGLPVLETTSSNNSGTRSSSSDWTVVFRPNNFKLKCVLVTIFGVICVQLCLLSVLLAPLLSGRWLVRFFQDHFMTQESSTTRTVHEIYSWTVGAVFCLICCKVLEFIVYPTRKHRNDHVEGEETMTLVSKLSYIIKIASKSCFIALFVCLIWPLQVGLLFTLLVNPLIGSSSGTGAFNLPITLPVIFFGSCWSLGFPLLRVLYSIRSHLPLPLSSINYISSDLRRFERLNLKEFFKYAAIPITLMFSLSLLLPPLSCLIAVPLFSPNPSMSTVIEFQNYSHFLALVSLVILKLVKAAVVFYQRLISGIRDETYLIGRRLHNLESRSNQNIENRNDLVSPLM